jgi:hypothetical protein
MPSERNNKLNPRIIKHFNDHFRWQMHPLRTTRLLRRSKMIRKRSGSKSEGTELQSGSLPKYSPARSWISGTWSNSVLLDIPMNGLAKIDCTYWNGDCVEQVALS